MAMVERTATVTATMCVKRSLPLSRCLAEVMKGPRPPAVHGRHTPPAPACGPAVPGGAPRASVSQGLKEIAMAVAGKAVGS